MSFGETESPAWTHRWREADSNRRSLSQKRAGLSGGTGSAVEAKRGCLESVIYQAGDRGYQAGDRGFESLSLQQ